MSRTHAHQDVYIDGKLTYADAIVVEQPEGQSMLVKQRQADMPGVHQTVARFTDVRSTAGRRGERYYRGTGGGGEVSIAAISNEPDCGCRH